MAEVITLAELARKLRVHPDTLRKAVADGTIRPLPISRKLLFDSDQVHADIMKAQFQAAKPRLVRA